MRTPCTNQRSTQVTSYGNLPVAIRVASQKGAEMRRTRYQQGSLILIDRKKGKVWKFRWREVQLDGSIRRRSSVVGSYDEYPSESAAQKAVDALRLNINQHTPRGLLKDFSVETLVKHYREHELPDIFHDPKPNPRAGDDLQKSYSTQYIYEIYLNRWILPRWRSYRLNDVKAVDVESGSNRSG